MKLKQVRISTTKIPVDTFDSTLNWLTTLNPIKTGSGRDVKKPNENCFLSSIFNENKHISIMWVVDGAATFLSRIRRMKNPNRTELTLQTPINSDLRHSFRPTEKNTTPLRIRSSDNIWVTHNVDVYALLLVMDDIWTEREQHSHRLKRMVFISFRRRTILGAQDAKK